MESLTSKGTSQGMLGRPRNRSQFVVFPRDSLGTTLVLLGTPTPRLHLHEHFPKQLQYDFLVHMPSFAIASAPTGVPIFDGEIPAFMSVGKISDIPILEGPVIEGMGADVGGIDGTCLDLIALNDRWEKHVDCAETILEGPGGSFERWLKIELAGQSTSRLALSLMRLSSI